MGKNKGLSGVNNEKNGQNLLKNLEKHQPEKN
jgi:hypothetical protein